eukprot:TRINITY_DN536_c0_g1_i1.p1 TRINITY_DN536_c0_g1~~TRINITY_DN536_c0_g1_i1.p1  ORF type:complete len:248 (-),score=63.19 TRINITY_DN536_c0_g1_i1:25-768(-)
MVSEKETNQNFEPNVQNFMCDLFIDNTAKQISQSIQEAISNGKTVLLGLSGGSCGQIYSKFIQLLATNEWKKIIVYLVDEKFVPENHYDSNVKMVKETLINFIQPLDFLYPLIVHGKSIAQTCKEYEKQIKNVMDQYQHKDDQLFVVNILGMGFDYHIASIFPPLDFKWVANQKNDDSFFISTYTNKFIVARRISSSLAFLNIANHSFLILNSKKKRECFDSMMQQYNPYEYPIMNLESPLTVCLSV